MRKSLWEPSPLRAGSGPTCLLPYRGGPGELDLEASLDRLAPGRVMGRDDLWVRGRKQPALNLLVLLDTSLSISGEARIPAAVAGAVLAREAAMARLALIAFHSEAETVIRFGMRIRPLEAAQRVLRLKWGGPTDLGAALKAGAKLLRYGPPGFTHTVLISDGEHTSGPDPRNAARRFSGLHMILIGRRNLALARDLTRLGKGGLRQAEGLKDLPGALMELLAGLARPV